MATPRRPRQSAPPAPADPQRPPGSPRRPWSDLTPAYRRRLERAGISPAAYAAGVPLGAARGHRESGESVTRVLRTLERYPEVELSKGQIYGHAPTGRRLSDVQRGFLGVVPVRLGNSRDAPSRVQDFRHIGFQQSSRLGRYLNDLKDLKNGELSGQEFSRRWRNRSVAGYRLEDRPDQALAAAWSFATQPGAEVYVRSFPPVGGRS